MRGLQSITPLLLAAIPALLGPAAAYAASDADPSSVNEVVVTAQRRTERVQDVPATITAVSGDQLKNLGYTDMKSVIALVPNATLPDDSENFEPFINIRGIRQADINAEPNFGLYRNGIFAGGERGNFGAQIDVDRVEILSGPQSGLYGRDAVGGVVNIIYATPTMDGLHGYLIGDYGRYNRAELQGAVNIPLAPNFAVRLTGWEINQEQGQLYDQTLKSYIDKNRSWGARLGAKWNVTPQLSVVWMAEYQDLHGPSLTAFAPNGIGNVFGVECCGLAVQGPETLKTITEDTPNTEHWDQLYLSQDITYDTHSWAGVFELQGAYKNYHLHLQEDQDHTAFGPTYDPSVAFQQIQYRDEGLHNIYVQGLWKSPAEAPLSWIIGADYFNETFRFDRIFAGNVNFDNLNTLFAPGFSYGNLLCSFLMAPYSGGCGGYSAGGSSSPGLPGAGTGKYPYTFPNIGVQGGGNAFGAPGSSIDTESGSAFVTANYKLTKAFNIRVDLRYDQTTKNLVYIQGPVAGYGSALAATYLDPLFAQIFDPYTDKQSDTYVNLTPSVTLQYEFSRSLNTYATYSNGFRAGSFNLGTSSSQYLSYKPEKDTNYEVGAKSLWLGNKLSLNGDFFYMTQSNLVEPETDASEPAFLGLYYLANVGSARTFGAEASANYQPFQWVNLGATAGWLDDRITNGSSQGVSLKGQQIPFTRHWTIDLSSSLNYPLTPNLQLVSNANYKLELGGFLDPSLGVLETVPYKTLQKLDVDAGVAFGNTRIVAYVDNAFNSIIPQFLYSDGIENVNLGRTYGARIQYKF